MVILIFGRCFFRFGESGVFGRESLCHGDQIISEVNREEVGVVLFGDKGTTKDTKFISSCNEVWEED